MKKINDIRTEVDNFSELSDLLFGKDSRPMSEEEFYFLQIITRGKDGGSNKNRLVKFYQIRSKEQLQRLEREIKAICVATNSRAYIHPTRRNETDVANVFLELTAKSFVNRDWKCLPGIFSTACGKSFVHGDKKFIVDLDGYSLDSAESRNLKEFVYSLRGSTTGDRIFGEIETVSGLHLITTSFDIGEFKKKYPDIDVHKNNPTLLYYLKNKTTQNEK